jgi:hypothetical protein
MFMPSRVTLRRWFFEEAVDMSFALGFPSTLSPTDHFNRLSAEEKGHVLSSGLGAGLLQSGLDFAVPLWWLLDDRETGLCLRNGSAFLADLGRGPIGITAAHVYREYLAAKRASVSIGCQLGSALIEPETRLICCRDDLDIATFRMSASEVEQIGKSVASHGPPQWAPLNPAVGNFAFFAGFPAQSRVLTPTVDFATAPYFAMTPITSITDHQIACRFDRERAIDFSGSGLPPQGYDMGGVSGGPLLIPTLIRDGDVEGAVWRFAGVIVQAAKGDMFEQVVAVRGHYVHADGQVG